VFFCEWWLKISAKPLFIGSIPIAASNLLNNLREADNGAAESITEK
jgi:hypothetical protein